ncbi:unnamed protein product [Mytilus coruscus]|uniref:Uncharacterized protein n=1 Tax=Mytilus coruscus TaxID=42192 RepID=A0A6J8C493_MYTCO|nr:unnamed protein product [Mytilus coruscus]
MVQLYPPVNIYGVVTDHDYFEFHPEDKWLRDNCISTITDEEISKIESFTSGQAKNPSNSSRFRRDGTENEQFDNIKNWLANQREWQNLPDPVDCVRKHVIVKYEDTKEVSTKTVTGVSIYIKIKIQSYRYIFQIVTIIVSKRLNDAIWVYRTSILEPDDPKRWSKVFVPIPPPLTQRISFTQGAINYMLGLQ